MSTFKYLVVEWYNDHKTVSRHRNYKLAHDKAIKSTLWGIVEIDTYTRSAA